MPNPVKLYYIKPLISLLYILHHGYYHWNATYLCFKGHWTQIVMEVMENGTKCKTLKLAIKNLRFFGDLPPNVVQIQ